MVIFDEQKELIAGLQDILNKSRKKNKWENIFEFLAVRSSYIEFISLTTDIFSAMNQSFKELLDSYDLNLLRTVEGIEKIIKTTTILMERHKNKYLRLPVIACLNESYRKTMKFYEKKYGAYRLKLKKRDEIESSISRLKDSFNSALVFMNNVLKKINKNNYVLVRNKLLIVFNLFDKRRPGSIYRVYKLIDSMIRKSLNDLSTIKNSVLNFVRSSNMALTNN